MDELLTGEAHPLSNVEFNYWSAYWGVKADIQDKVTNEAKKKGAKAVPEGPKMRKTMGS